MLASVVRQLNQADLSTVRNGLDHMKGASAFPSPDLMLACLARLGDAFDLADTRRYIPKSYWLQSNQTERYGHQTLVFSDYRGKSVTLGGPPVVSGLPSRGFHNSVVIAPGNLLGEPNSELCFAIRERSAYSDYWANYPRRRKITAQHVLIRKGEPLEQE